MSLETPTTQAVADNIVAQLEASLSQTVPLLPRAFIRVLARALSGVFVLIYKYAGWMSLQLFVRYASIDRTEVSGRLIRPLVEWGRLIGAGVPEPATQAELLIDVEVETQGGTLPSGSQLLKARTGVTYITLGGVLLNASTVQATVRAVSDQQGGAGAGTIGNLGAGETLSFASPLAAVKREAVVVEQVVTGSDAESADDYRQRIFQRFQRRPQGGAYTDYRTWALEVPGIISAFPYTGTPGRVNVYVEATEESSGNADGIPTPAQLDAVEASILLDQSGLNSRRPLGTLVEARAITRLAFDVEVTDLVVDDEAAVQASIEAAIDEHLRAREPFIVGLSVPPRRDRVAQAAIAGMIDEIVSAAAGTFESVTVELAASPVSVYTLDEGETAKLGSLSFVTS